MNFWLIFFSINMAFLSVMARETAEVKGGSVSPAQPSKPLPSHLNGQYFSLKENAECTEIQTMSDKDMDGKQWSYTNVGGNDRIFSGTPELKQNLVNDVNFGPLGSKVRLNLQGKNINDTIRDQDSAGVAFYYLRSSEDKMIYGKFLGFTDRGPNGSVEVNGKRHDKLKIGIFYFNSKPSSSSLQVSCTYVRENIPFQEMEKSGKCFWIDSDSRSSNGKPYCW